MNGDPLLAFLMVLGGAMVLGIFLPPWRRIAAWSWRLLRSTPGRVRHLVHRIDHAVMRWAEVPCSCRHCVAIRELLDDPEWDRFIREHDELRPRKQAS